MFLKTFDPGHGGFMFTRNPEVTRIIEEVNNDYGGHSGASLGMTMRVMQYIAMNNNPCDSNSMPP